MSWMIFQPCLQIEPIGFSLNGEAVAFMLCQRILLMIKQDSNRIASFLSYLETLFQLVLKR